VFENIFNKAKPPATNGGAEKSGPVPASQSHGASVQASEQPPAITSAEETQAWQDQILAAGSDNAALLQLVHEAPTTALKLAAIQALTQEGSLKQVMHDFREHDKRLYRAAKSLWQAIDAKREAIAEANTLIAAARALLEQELVPVNRVVELDRAWAAINVDLLDASLQVEFAALSTQLGETVRARGEHVQALTRWLSATDNAVSDLSAALPNIARGDIAPAEAESLAVSLLELVHGLPDAGDTRCIEKADTAKRLLALASSVVQRAGFLQALPATGGADEIDEKRIIEQWRGFPEMSEGELHTVLATRFADWRNAGTSERQREHDAQNAEERERRAEKNKQRLSVIQRDVEAAETAQAGGHIADLTRLLSAIDHALKRGPVNAALTQRIELLRSEQRRLQDWQRWSGGQGREQLAAEAQELAGLASGKVSIKAHTEAIGKLRDRWKELDRLGGASNQTVWLAFDGALETAYAPVAAHLEKLKLARTENLTARKEIISGLEQAAARFFPPAVEGGASTPATDWRALSRTLDGAQLEWRKLGPVEHTVPRNALRGENAVTTRYAAAVQALSAPLKNAYGDARLQREQLIAAATELAASDVSARDVVDKVRKLQTQWQSIAKSMPLPRRDENAMWAAFKVATDAIFTARDAAREASTAAFNTQLQVRTNIIEKVSALASLASAPEIKRALAEAETAWHASPEVPKSHVARMDARYRVAREAVSRRIGELAAHASQARYDALIAKMTLCDELEIAQGSDGAISEELAVDLETRWNAVEHIPNAWNARLDARFRGNISASGSGAAPKAGQSTSEGLPDILLNLEVACAIDTPEEFLAARQQLKIRALKSAMEGRQTVVATPADIERWLLDAAVFPRPDDVSRARLAKIITAVRARRQA
jgi:DNA repair protein SbcC/Rad50